jgi:hypothetical protein
MIRCVRFLAIFVFEFVSNFDIRTYGFEPLNGCASMTHNDDRRPSFQEGVERRILHGLACEWEAALWVLDPEQQRSMRRPLFSIRELKTRLGYWSCDKREICLSRQLVLNHGWDAVKEVLVHEMAHQFVDEVLKTPGEETPHGPTFQRACCLLRANPKASGSFAPLDTRIQAETEHMEDNRTVRVRKLMALAQSCNRHEAESAMAKAHELMAKYNLDRIERADTIEFFTLFVGCPRLRHRREEYRLAGLVQDFYFVYGIWAPAYVLEKGKMGRVLEISGTRQNVKVASYVFDFVVRYIDSQWSQYNKDRRLNEHRKSDFAVGIIEGFRSKLESQRKQVEEKIRLNALIRKKDRPLMDYVAHRYPHTVNFRSTASRRSPRIFADGIQIGRQLIIAQGIAERSVREVALIGRSTLNPAPKKRSTGSN